MPTIRALTFFIPVYDWFSNQFKKDVENFIFKSLELSDKLELFQWTTRFVLPPIPKNSQAKDCSKIVDSILSFNFKNNILLQAFPVTPDCKCIEDIVDILSLDDKIYSTILVSNEADIDGLVNKIYLRDVDPNIYTRISITYGNWVETAYFPSTANSRNKFGYSVALRYLDLMSRYLMGEKELLIDFLKELKDKILNYEDYFYGVDYSLSPWMEESVGKLIEKRYNITLGGSGTYDAVYKLNKEIHNIVSMNIVSSTGFNEVMLPVGEDNLLKERVKDKTLKLGHLEGLSSVCVVGLDMVAIKKDEFIINGVLHDMFSIYKIKGKPIGLRIIPIEEDGINLKKFGYLPLIDF